MTFLYSQTSPEDAENRDDVENKELTAIGVVRTELLCRKEETQLHHDGRLA